MNNYYAAAKVLDELMLELLEKGVVIPPHVADDLKSCRSMAGLGRRLPDDADLALKTLTVLQSVEMNLLSLAEAGEGAGYADGWQSRIISAYQEEAQNFSAGTASGYVSGVPRADHRVRLQREQLAVLPEPEALLEEFSLSFIEQEDGWLLIHGRKENVTSFLAELREKIIKSRLESEEGV